MLVSDILKNIKYTTASEELLTADVPDISSDSRKADNAVLFFAYKGSSFDSHDEAVRLYTEGKITGAVAERELDIPCVVVENGRHAFSKACSNYFGNPAAALTTVAVTGTNGKTTITWLIEKIFNTAGMPCVRIGTTGASIMGKTVELDNTTPSPYDFYSFLAEGVKAGAKTAVAEVSSHALEQDRLYGMVFDVAIYTNLTGDHLDYHPDLESYYLAKKKLFGEYSRKHVINISNDYGKRLYDEAGAPKISFGINAGDISASRYTFTADGTRATISCNVRTQSETRSDLLEGKDYSLESPLVGEFNLENILAAVSGTVAAGVVPEVAVKAAGMLENVPGRLERYSDKGVSVFVDYAHTDDALKNVLETLRILADRHLITVFGAGGDRDNTKRPRMGKVAQRYSDLVVVTSDNPRTEDPLRIIADITAGMVMDDIVHVEPDREKAIAYAINAAEAGDMIVIAGKGHEDYQIIGTTKHHFSDSEIVQKYLAAKEA